MVARIFVECPVCRKITLMRYQRGFLNEHSINFKCGECETEIEGKFCGNKINFFNGRKTDNQDAQFVVPCSGELLTEKLKRVNSYMDIIGPSPFIGATMMMSSEKYLEFKRKVLDILKYKNGDSFWVKNVNNLYHRNNEKLLCNEIWKKLPKEKFPVKNKMDILRAVHHVNIIQYLVLLGEEFEINSNFIFCQFEKLIKDKRTQLDAYGLFLKRINVLHDWELKIANINDRMIHAIESFIPIIGIEYYPLNIDEVKNIYAINTFRFEDVKQLYVDLYELLTDMLPLLMGMDNLSVRSEFNKIRIPNSLNNNKITTLEELINNSTKACRVNYIESNEPFEKIIYGKLNQTIRNSIGHFNYDIFYSDVFEQIITFKHLKDSRKDIQKSLIEVCYEIWNMYKCIFVFDEIIYNMRRIQLDIEGIRASKIEPIVINHNYSSKTIRKGKKIGRNDMCPCGSGLKFKRCCGKNQ